MFIIHLKNFSNKVCRYTNMQILRVNRCQAISVVYYIADTA